MGRAEDVRTESTRVTGADAGAVDAASAAPPPTASAASVASASSAAPSPTAEESSASHHPDHSAAARSRWARLLARIFEVFPLLCPDCGAEMRILAFLTEPEPVRAILRHLDLPTTPPRLSPARGPPQHDLNLDVARDMDDMDQTPAFDPTDPEPIPDFD